MMGKKDYSERSQVQIASLDDLVPSGHLVRKLEEAIDLSFIYDEVKDLYKPYGRESIDPVVLMKIVILQYVFGIPSMRKTIKEIEVNLAYRWYLGYGLYEDIPHFSTFGKNYTRRFKDTDLFQKIFSRILMEVDACGFLDTESLFIDGTHIKASANPHKYQNETMEKEARCYEKELQEEIEKDRLEHGKKPLKEKESTPETINKKVSTTDPDSGWFHKGEHKQVFAYAANTCCDKNNYVIDFEVTAGNVHDSVSFWELYRKVSERVKYPKYYVMDAGYKIPAIARTLIEEGKVPVMPYKRPMTKKGYFRKSDYVYDEYFDCYLCPNNQILKYSTTNRDGYREYKSDGKKCKDCPYQNQCTGSKDHVKVVSRHVWEGYMEKVEEIRHQTGMKEIYQKRKETIERVFADGKEKHGMRYTQYRGLAKVTMELTLLFACMNLKKLAIWKWRKGGLRKPCSFVCIFEPIYLYIKFKMVPGTNASIKASWTRSSQQGRIYYNPHQEKEATEYTLYLTVADSLKGSIASVSSLFSPEVGGETHIVIDFGKTQFFQKAHTLAGVVVQVRKISGLWLFLSVLVWVFSLGILFASAGWKRGSDTVQIRWIDRIPFGIYTGISGLAFLGCGMVCLYMGDLLMQNAGIVFCISFFTIAFALAELIVYEYVISIIVRIRAGKFWHYTLLRLLLNPFRRIKRELHEIRLALLASLSMTVKVTAVFLVVFLIEAFLLLCAGADGGIIMVYLLWKVVEYGVLLKIVVQFRQIFDGGERIAKGDYSHPIHTEKMMY